MACYAARHAGKTQSAAQVAPVTESLHRELHRAHRSCEAAQQRSAGASAGAWRAYTSARCAALAVSRSAPQNGGVQRKASPRAV